MIVVRPTTAEDVMEFYGEMQFGSMRATSAIKDGRVIGIIGIIREANYGRFFSDFTEELKPYLRSVTIMRAIKRSLVYCDDYGGPVLALSETSEGCRIMNRLGFTHIQGGWYGWLN